jgi:endonuclease YncB( thermonuclease family)
MRWLALALALAVHVTWAETLVGRVVGITDGDTLTIVDADRIQHKIRIAGIDAPEKRQPFGEASRQNLAHLTFGKLTTVKWYKRSYKRLVGNAFVNGKDIGLEQVRAGMAWHYKAYEHEQTSEARVQYAIAEVRARRERLGLWKDKDPIPPWEWRHMRR